MIQRMTPESTRQDKTRSDMHCYILLLFLCFYAGGRAGNNGLSRSEGSTLLGKPAALSSWWPAECGIIFCPRATSRCRPFNCLWGGRSTASATAPPPALALAHALTHVALSAGADPESSRLCVIPGTCWWTVASHQRRYHERRVSQICAGYVLENIAEKQTNWNPDLAHRETPTEAVAWTRRPVW